MSDALQDAAARRPGTTAGPSLWKLSILAAVVAFVLGPMYLNHRAGTKQDALIAGIEADAAKSARLADAKAKEEAAAEEERRAERDAELKRQADAEAAALGKAKALGLLNAAESATRAVADLDAAENAWEAALAAAHEPEVGGRIAADRAALRRVAGLLERHKSLVTADAAVLRGQLEAVVSPVRAAAEAPRAGYAPAADTAAEVERVRREATAALPVLKELTSRLATTISAAERSGAEPAAITLAEGLERLDQAEAADLLAELDRREEDRRAKRAEELDRARADADDKIAAAALAAERLRGEKEAERLKLESEADAARRDDEAAARRAELARARLEREFAADRAAVSRHLAVFTSDGSSYRGRNAPAEKSPASLKAIQGSGALDDSEAGLANMLKAHLSNYNDRSGADWAVALSWKLPSAWPDERRAYILETQRLLRKYGDLMVEKGSLIR